MTTTRRMCALSWRWRAVLVAVVLAVLAIAVPAGLAGTGHAAGSGAAPKERAERPRAVAAAASSGCHVSWTTSEWPGQFAARVTLTNTGTTAVDGWKLTFTFPGDQAISSAWNATFTQTGTSVSAANTDYYDASIRPRASRSLGFLGTWQSDGTAPTDFRVNGTVCR